jgi:hypothetical protein
MVEEIKYKISFDQSVSSGIIGFHGSVEFTDENKATALNFLVGALHDQERIFRDNSYRVASDIEPKEKKEVTK